MRCFANLCQALGFTSPSMAPHLTAFAERCGVSREAYDCSTLSFCADKMTRDLRLTAAQSKCRASRQMGVVCRKHLGQCRAQLSRVGT